MGWIGLVCSNFVVHRRMSDWHWPVSNATHLYQDHAGRTLLANLKARQTAGENYWGDRHLRTRAVCDTERLTLNLLQNPRCLRKVPAIVQVWNVLTGCSVFCRFG